MARKKRTKTTAKKAKEKKKNDSQATNGSILENSAVETDLVKCENADSKLESDNSCGAVGSECKYEDSTTTTAPVLHQEESSRSDLSSSSACLTNSSGLQSSDKYPSHKRFGKFRYLERRRSSSGDDDTTPELNLNTAELMPLDIQQIVLGDVKDVTIRQYDSLDNCLISEDVGCDIVIEDSAMADVIENVDTGKVKVEETIIDETAECLEETLKVTKSDTVKCYSPKKTQTLQQLKVTPEDEPQHMQINSVKDEGELQKENEVESETQCQPIFKEAETNMDPIKVEKMETDEKESPVKTEIEVKPPRRRSNRIRVNRWDEGPKVPVKVPPPSVDVAIPVTVDPAVIQSSFATPPPPPLPSPTLDSSPDKPVKVKSRWRRTSELEMGAVQGDGSLAPLPPPPPPPVESLQSPAPPPSCAVGSTPPLPPAKLPLVTSHPEIDEQLKKFEIIRQNDFLTTRTRSKEAKRMVCDCTLTKEEIAREEDGCGEDCINRLLMIECGSRCILGNLCSNKRFQNCEYSKCEVFLTEKKGLGLVSGADIPSGSFLMEYVGEVIDPKEFRRRAKEYAKEKNRHFYFMALKSDAIIDATMKGNISRFINHSCDPNSETQKWTVNGELRIGFFSIRSISKGEEITFDYQLQRYGKEAQRCYCESSNCRGWIGVDPEKEDKDEKDRSWGRAKEKREKKMRREDLEEEIEKLRLSGVKNQKLTLQFNRLMVRAEDHSTRGQLLNIVLGGVDQRCLRLFLDYHGLGLLWSWMMDSSSPVRLNIKILDTLAVLPITNKTILKDSKVLSVVEKWSDSVSPETSIEKKEGEENSSPDSEENGGASVKDGTKMETETPREEQETAASSSPTEEETERRTLKEKAKALLEVWAALQEEFRIPKKERIEQMKEHEREADRGYVDPEKSKTENQSYDRHWCFDKDSLSGPVGSSRRSRNRNDDSNRHQSTNGPRLSKVQRRQLFALKVEEEERQKRLTEERWAKHQEQCFALGVDPNTTIFQHHNGYFHPPQPMCHQDGEMFSGYPPQFMASFPPPGQPHFHPNFGQGPPPPVMGPYPGAPSFPHQGPLPPPHQGPLAPPHPNPMHPPPGSLPPPHQGPLQPSNPGSIPPPHPGALPPPHPGALPPPHPGALPPPHPGSLPPPHPGSLPPHQGQLPPPPLQASLPPPHQTSLPPPLQASLPPTHQGTLPPGGPMPVGGLPPGLHHLVAGGGAQSPFLQPPPAININSSTGVETQPPLPPPAVVPFPPKLPNRWKAVKDDKGRTYYYHIKVRRSQWLYPTPQQVAAAEAEAAASLGGSMEVAASTTVAEDESDDTDDDESDSEEEDSSSDDDDEKPPMPFQDEEEEEDFDELLLMEAKKKSEDPSVVNSETNEDTLQDSVSGSAPTPTLRRKRDGLVQVAIISPRDEDYDYRKGVKKSKIRETKQKLARQKLKLKARAAAQAFAASHPLLISSKSKNKKAKTCEADTSSGPSRRIKDKFRVQMANVIVALLNPYRKPDCKVGRIQNTDDFKHLARKLTHFVMVKELKHIASIEELQCNDNVKHKARDFIRKYMSKFGTVYTRISDE